MTYSIVARCPDTRMLGLGIASHVLAVGRVAMHIQPGVGAVVSQSLPLMAHGARTLAGIGAGLSPTSALEQSLALDSDARFRQVGAVTAAGERAAHTGDGCIGHASHVLGEGFCAQANLMANDGVPRAMAQAFRSGAGDPLALRLLSALDAAERVGGDLRGRQSAALVVVGPELTGDPLVDRVVDVRVDDHPEPLVELRRLTGLALANQRLDVADGLLAAGDVWAASAAYAEASDLAPDYLEFRFWHALALAGAGEDDQARTVWEAIDVCAERDRWGELVGRCVSAGLVPEQVADVLPPAP